MAEFGLPENPFLFDKEDWVSDAGCFYDDDHDDDDEFKILNVIGRGSFGVVYRARDKRNKETVAMKEEVGGPTPSTLREIAILKSLPRHPNVVGFKRVAASGGRVFVVMEYLKYDLERVRVRNGRPFSTFQTKALISEILKGVAFLHAEGVVHRDLKPANVLYGGVDKVKICDFGLAAPVGSCGRGVGTRWYMAPEVLGGWCGCCCTGAVDVWSVGCIMAEFVLDRPLFPGRSDAHQLECIREVLCGRSNMLRLVVSAYSGAAALSPLGFDLLERLLEYDPSERISAREALSHHWFTEV